MKVFYNLFKQDIDSREGTIIVTSSIGIIVNIFLALIKIIIGTLGKSIAILSEGINNLSDVISSIVNIVGTKLSKMHPTKNHPFGYGRIEYLTGLVIEILILVAGFELVKGSIERIIEPDSLSVNYLSIIVIFISAIVKFSLGVFTVKEGKRVDSTSLIAIGNDCKSDCIISVFTLIALVVFVTTGKNVDAFAGLIGAFFLLKGGILALKETIGDLLGRSGETELAEKLYKEILKEPLIINAADLILHNYGPDTYHGSINIEIDHDKSVGEVYKVIHALQLRIMHEYNVILVFGMYAVDTDSPKMKDLRNYITTYTKSIPNIESFHAVYIDPDNNDIYCDFVVDYELKDWDKVKEDFIKYMHNKYPNSKTELVLETKYV